MDSTSSEAVPHDVTIVVRQPGRRPLKVVVDSSLEIGRDCDGLLIADNQASRRHIELVPTASGLMATDLGSTNGTLLDGQRIAEPVVLLAGSRLTVGNTIVELAVDAPPAAAVEGFDPRATSIDLIAADVDRSPLDPTSLQDEGGTITIVFSDIESSTERAGAMGDADWYRVLGTHNEIVRTHLSEHRGTEIKNQGDGFMLTFPSARGAVLAMIGMQRDLDAWAVDDPDAVRVRMGAHVGEAIHDGSGDLFGMHVMRAARVAGLADGRQILVSAMVKELVEPRGDIRLGPGRTVQLKGIDGDHLIYEVDWTP